MEQLEKPAPLEPSFKRLLLVRRKKRLRAWERARLTGMPLFSE